MLGGVASGGRRCVTPTAEKGDPSIGGVAGVEFAPAIASSSKIMASRNYDEGKVNDDAKGSPIPVRMQRFDSHISPRHLGVTRGSQNGEKKQEVPKQGIRRGRRPTVAAPKGRQQQIIDNNHHHDMRVPLSVYVGPGDIRNGSHAFAASPPPLMNSMEPLPAHTAIVRPSMTESPSASNFIFRGMVSFLGMSNIVGGWGSIPGSRGHDDEEGSEEGIGFVIDETDMKQLFEKYGGAFYRTFPLFETQRYLAEYQEFQRTFFSLPSAIFMLAVVTVTIVNPDYINLAPSTKTVSYEGRSSLALFCAWFILATLYIVFMALGPAVESIVPLVDATGGGRGRLLKRQNSVLPHIYALRKWFVRLWIGRNIENVLGLTISVIVGLRALALVTDEAASSSVLGGGGGGSAPSLPDEILLSIFLVPIAAQKVFKGMDIRTVAISWTIGIIFIVLSYYKLDNGWNPSRIWALIVATLFLLAFFEYERFVRLSFVHSKVHNAVERSRLLAVDEKNTHVMETNRRWMEQKMHLEKTDMERKSIEQESAQLRSLIGNVAHDLKTPLQSMAMGMEILKSSILASNLFSMEVAGGGDGGDGLRGVDSQDPIREPFDAQEAVSLLDSLVVTGSFMSMAINRAVDFTKATSGIALVPSYVTFDLHEAFDMPIACMNNVQSTISIVVEPLPWNICPYVISDRHWFIENILCLLSNAVKYSDGGCVTVALEHLPRDAESDACMSPHQTMNDGSEYSSVAVTSGPMIRLRVEDTGIGIPPELRKTLFRPFKQAQRMTGGTGLGLYSLAKRIEALGGMYGISDRRDGKKGCGIWFAFPYRPDLSMVPDSSSTFFGIDGLCESHCSSPTRAGQRSVAANTDGSSTPHRSQSLFLPPTGDVDDLPHSSSASSASRLSGVPRILEAIQAANLARDLSRKSLNKEPLVCPLPRVAEERNGIGKGGESSAEGSVADEKSSEKSHSPAATTAAAAACLPVITCAALNLQAVALPKERGLQQTASSTGTASTRSLVAISLHDSPQGLHVLLVDDALSILKVTGKALTQKGNTVETAQNGSIAFDRLSKSLEVSIDKGGVRDFQVVLMDLQMPVMDGFEAVRRYREAERNFYRDHPNLVDSSSTVERYGHHLLIIGASANSDSVSRQEALAAGMDFFIPKPYTYNDLLPFLHSEGLSSRLKPSPASRPVTPTSQMNNQQSLSARSSTTSLHTPSKSSPEKHEEEQGLHVLLVDDALSILKVTGKALTQKGNTVETAQNGSIAFDRLSKSLEVSIDKGGARDFQVVLMDLQMPVMDGFEAVRRYREAERNFYQKHPELIDSSSTVERYGHHLLIIGASANSDSVSRQEALAAGMDFFIPKPYTYNDLLPFLHSEGLSSRLKPSPASRPVTPTSQMNNQQSLSARSSTTSLHAPSKSSPEKHEEEEAQHRQQQQQQQQVQHPQQQQQPCSIKKAAVPSLLMSNIHTNHHHHHHHHHNPATPGTSEGISTPNNTGLVTREDAVSALVLESPRGKSDKTRSPTTTNSGGGGGVHLA